MNEYERKNTDLEYINRIYNYIKNDMPVEAFMYKFKCGLNELKGILELCRIYGKNIDGTAISCNEEDNFSITLFLLTSLILLTNNSISPV